MLRRRGQHERGDTLIEVLFATAVFSLTAVGALLIMNQGSADAERTLEVTVARQQIDAQAETLRFLNASYVAAYQSGQTTYDPSTPAGQWAALDASVKQTNLTGASAVSSGNTCQTPPAGSFVVDPETATFVPPSQNALKPAVTYAQLVESPNFEAQGIWVEAIRSPDGSGSLTGTGFTDFHIYTCWPSPGESVPVTLATIVRLYEPRS